MTSSVLKRLEQSRKADNTLDVLVEVALFKPDEIYSAARPNNAGTKVIFTRRDGEDETCWAFDWTREPYKAHALAALRTAASTPTGSKGEGE